MDTYLVCIVGLVLLLSAGGCAREASLPMSTDFQKPPLASGWLLTGNERGACEGTWATEDTSPPNHYISFSAGRLDSPLFTVEPFAWYRLRFRSKSPSPGYVAAVSFDDRGIQLLADDYNSIPESPEWSGNEICTRGKATAARAIFRFTPIRDGQTICIDDVSVEQVPTQAVASWSDAVYATLPPVTFTPPADRWDYLPRTRQKLQSGGPLRIVLLGDSIANDTGNAPFDALIQRRYPKARIEVVTSVRGGTGCQYYQSDNRIKPYVLDFQPDLLIIAGISNGSDSEAIRNVIRQVRQHIQPDIVVMTGAVAPVVPPSTREFGVEKAREMTEAARTFPVRLRAVAADEKVAYLDMRSAWDDYVKTSAKPDTFFRRDPIHANARGRQILARILERYFTAEP